MEYCTSILIDSALRNSKGHYEQFSYDFRQALIRSGKKVVYISPSADLAKESDGAVSPLISYQFIDAVSKSSFFDQCLDMVKKVTESSSEPFHLIFLRANDLAAGNLIDWSKFIDKHQQIDLKVLINVSGMISNSSHSKPEREVLNKLGIFKDKIRYMAWDFRVTKSKEFSNFEYLPLYKNPVKKRNVKSQLRVGFFGKLTSDRGLTDLLFSTILNPRLKFVIRGYDLSFRYLYRRPGFLSVKKNANQSNQQFFPNYLYLLSYEASKCFYV